MKGLINQRCQMDACNLKQALPHRQSFCDIDLSTERNGNILLIEAKEHVGVYGPATFTSKGQMIQLQAYARYGIDVALVAGPYTPTNVEGVYTIEVRHFKVLQKFTGKVPAKWTSCEHAEFLQWIMEWNKWANFNPRV